MAADSLSITEQWIREKLSLQHSCLADVRSLSLPGSYETGKICHLGISLKNFIRLKSLDLSHNALESVQGIVHLKLLEKLNLYYNRLWSLEDVLALRRLQNLEELDLRLNPVVQKQPYYRLYLVHTISKLRKLDDFPVRDRERKAALMHFSVESAVKPSQKSQVFTKEKENRSSDHRIASVNKMMMRKLSLREGNEETVLNHKFSEDRNTEVQEDSPLAEEKTRRESTHSPGSLRKIIVFNLYSSIILFIVCWFYSQGAYKKPMELLLSLVDEYWAGKKKNYNTKHFFMQAVRILCMMEQEVVSGEEEMKALREKIQTLNTQAELQKRQHQSEIQSLSEQLQRAYGSAEQLDEQLRSVLEENVSLQKQLIRLEQKLLSDQIMFCTCLQPDKFYIVEDIGLICLNGQNTSGN
uniref:Centrosomal protein of 72 kDa n=1 Tax=Pygocentrus nattereri TaxID=42514 RepID=A0A3B4BWK4_PYGNA